MELRLVWPQASVAFVWLKLCLLPVAASGACDGPASGGRSRTSNRGVGETGPWSDPGARGGGVQRSGQRRPRIAPTWDFLQPRRLASSHVLLRPPCPQKPWGESLVFHFSRPPTSSTCPEGARSSRNRMQENPDFLLRDVVPQASLLLHLAEPSGCLQARAGTGICCWLWPVGLAAAISALQLQARKPTQATHLSFLLSVGDPDFDSLSAHRARASALMSGASHVAHLSCARVHATARGRSGAVMSRSPLWRGGGHPIVAGAALGDGHAGETGAAQMAARPTSADVPSRRVC